MRPFLLACMMAAAGTAAGAQTPGVALVDAVPSITVEGTAKRDVRPDLAVVTLGVTTDRPLAADAAGDNARAANMVVAAARAAGLQDADIQTSDLRLFALSDSRDASRTRTFRASNQVALRLHDTGKVGTLIGQVVAHGANDIESIDFQVADPEPIISDLRREATTDARRKAEAYAAAAGVALGRVLRIAPDGARPFSEGVGSRMQVAAPAPAPPVEAGSRSLAAAVQVTWELKEPAAAR